MKPLHVRYTGPVGCPTGYGQAAHDTLMALLDARADLEIDPVLPPDPGVLGDRFEELLEYPKRYTEQWPTHYLVHVAPKFAHHMAYDDLAPPRSVPRLLYTTWETSRLPAELIHTIDENYAHVIVPSQHNATAFEHSGLARDKLHVIPHAVDPAWWDPQLLDALDPRNPANADLNPARPFTFYSILTWCERKNPIGLLKAYFAAFLRIPNVRLVLVSTLGVSREDFEALRVATRLPLDSLPKVEFVTGPTRLTDTAVRQLHVEADCYVTTSRGEGFGLPLLEAALTGNVIIAPRWSGYRDFLDSYARTMYIDTQMTPAFPGPGSLDAGAITPDQLWGEPDLAACIAAMRKAYASVGLDRKTPSAKILAAHSYQTVGAAWRRLLEAI